MKEPGAITGEASVTTKNLATVVLLRAAQYPFLALFVMLIPRAMGPEVYGEYALLVSIISIAASLMDVGVTETYGRFIPEFESRGDSRNITRFSSNMLTFKVVTDLVISIILFLILDFAYGDRFPVSYFILMITILLVSDWGGVPYALLFGLNKLAKYSLRDPVRRALSLVFILILFHYYGLLGAIMSILIIEGSLTTLYFFWARRYFSVKDFTINISFLKPYLKFGFMFYISWGLLNVWQRLGNPLIEYATQDSREIALFDIPNQIFLVMASFTFFVIISLVPIFAKLLLTGKEEKLINWSRLIMKYTAIISTVILGAFVLVGPDLIPVMIGSEYREIFPNGVVLLLGMFPMIVVQLGFVFSMIYKEPGKYFQALCFGFAVFVIASLLLIPKYASLGCSVATFISSIVLAVVMCVLFRERLFPCLADGLKVTALGFIFVPFLFFKGSIITNISLLVFALIAYILSLFASRVLKLSEVYEIFHAIRYQPEA